MSVNDDVSWQTLRVILRDFAGSATELAEARPLEGGMINTTLCLVAADGQKVVLKISPHRVNRDFEREAHQLELLRGIGLPTPRVYQCHTGSLDNPHSYILMEFVEGIDLGSAKTKCGNAEYESLQLHLADLLLLLHAQTSDTYRRAIPGEPPSFGNWPAFYRHVYDPIVAEVVKHQDVPPKLRKQIGKLHDRLDALLAHDDCPRLTHWDIWSTNILCHPDPQGNWRISAVLDPNCKFAHAEAELAYIDLFHTASHAFLKAYQRERRLDDGYLRYRKAVYQLYPLIHHVSLFGQTYVKSMAAALERCG